MHQRRASSRERSKGGSNCPGRAAEAEKRASLDRLAAVERADRNKVMAMDDEANNLREPATQARVRRL